MFAGVSLRTLTCFRRNFQHNCLFVCLPLFRCTSVYLLYFVVDPTAWSIRDPDRYNEIGSKPLTLELFPFCFRLAATLDKHSLVQKIAIIVTRTGNVPWKTYHWSSSLVAVLSAQIGTEFLKNKIASALQVAFSNSMDHEKHPCPNHYSSYGDLINASVPSGWGAENVKAWHGPLPNFFNFCPKLYPNSANENITRMRTNTLCTPCACRVLCNSLRFGWVA